MDAVHKRGEEEGSSSAPPRREDITDTMIFSPSDLVTMICRDVDLNYATRGKMHGKKVTATDFSQTCNACIAKTVSTVKQEMALCDVNIRLHLCQEHLR